jgi:hypothetical protein
MKRKYITLLAATTLLCAACSNSDDAESIYPESDLAVHFTAGVESLATRATTAATALAEGTTVRISRDGSTYYNYQSTDADGTLAPTGSDFVTWAATKENNILIYACSPAATELSSDISTAQEFTLTTDQSDGTAVADYATFVGTVSRLGSKLGASDYNDVTFTLQRRMSQVNFSIANYDAKFEGYGVAVRVNSPASKVRINYALDNTGMTDDYIATLTTEGEPRSVTPYNGVLTIGEDIAKETTTAIITPNAEVAANEKFVSLTLISPNGDYSTTMDVVGIPMLEAGKSYKFDLTLSDDRVYIGSVKVISWVDQHLEGTEDASLDLTDPYVLDLSLYENSTDAELYDQLYEAFTECQNLTTLQITGDLGDRSLSTLLGSGDSRVPMKRLDMSALTGLTEIPSSLFSGNTNLQDVKLSEAVTKINSSAFNGCTSLQSVSFKSVTTIGNYAFNGCTNLEEVYLPLVTSLNYCEFNGCNNLKILYLPKWKNYGYAPLGYNTKPSNCDLTVNVGLKDNVKGTLLAVFEDGEVYGMYGYYTFKSITIVDDDGNVVDLTAYTLNLDDYDSATSDADLYSMLSNAFASGSAYTKLILKGDIQDRNICNILGCNYSSASYSPAISIPKIDMTQLKGLTEVPFSAFWENTALEDIKLSDDVTSLSMNAFYGCNNLVSITANGVKTIYDSAFKGCASLTEISLPEVTEVNRYVFSECTNLTRISLPKALNVSSGSFDACSNLEYVYLPSATYEDCFDETTDYTNCDLVLNLSQQNNENKKLATRVEGNNLIYVYTTATHTIPFKSITLVTVDDDGNVTPVTE